MSQFKRVEDGIFIGPQPTEQDIQEAKQQGIRTVIDFRLPSETATSNETLTKSHGLAYVNIPVNKAALSASQISDLDAAMKGKEARDFHRRSGQRDPARVGEQPQRRAQSRRSAAPARWPTDRRAVPVQPRSGRRHAVHSVVEREPV